MKKGILITVGVVALLAVMVWADRKFPPAQAPAAGMGTANTPSDAPTISLKDVNGEPVVEDVSYDSLGCSISQASASVMSDLVIGKPVAEAMTISQAFLELMQSKGSRVEGQPDEGLLEDAVAFVGVSKYPARIKCALLGWMAWKDATAQAMEVAQ